MFFFVLLLAAVVAPMHLSYVLGIRDAERKTHRSHSLRYGGSKGQPLEYGRSWLP